MAPFSQFSSWLDEAKSCKAIAEPTAMTLATVGFDGQPSARIVLLKEFDQRGFVFYTNMESRKSRELGENPKAALCFYWMALSKQVRIEGYVERVDDAAADEYFATRPRMSQVGAWASLQSQALESREQLMERVREVEAQYEGKTIPRPPHWSGWRLVAQRIEFWQQADYRLHDREVFVRSGQDWVKEKLYP